MASERTLTIYLSGPITGMPQKNDPLFATVSARLRADGHRVYNPRERPWDGARRAFAAYCAFICQEADAIVLLPGWENSKGATTERGLAENCGLEIIEWSTWAACEQRCEADNLLELILADDTPVGPGDAESLRLFQKATEDGKSRVAKIATFLDDVGGGP